MCSTFESRKVRCSRGDTELTPSSLFAIPQQVTFVPHIFLSVFSSLDVYCIVEGSCGIRNILVGWGR